MVLDILKYNIEDMTTYIINNINNISNEEKEEILRNKRVRERYFEEDNHYYFVYLVQRLGLNLSFFYDDDFLERLVKDKKVFDKLVLFLVIFHFSNGLIDSFEQIFINEDESD